MGPPERGHLGPLATPLGWLLNSPAAPNAEAQGFLLAQMLGSAASAVMGSFCSALVLAGAALRTGQPLFEILLACEAAMVCLRLAERRNRPRRMRKDGGVRSVSIGPSVLLSLLWCAFQGGVAFLLMRSGDPVLQVLSATLAMALLGPICARNYAAPRFAALLVMLCDLPFVAGAVLSGEPYLLLILALTPPFLIGAFQIIRTFHDTLLSRLVAEQETRRIATRDSLTGVLNRYGMDEALKALSPGPERTMALLAIDLDGFKQVNDAHGHGAGDLVLMEVARRLQAHLHEDDLLGRMGGDEFMIVLRNAEPASIPRLAERLVRAVSEAPVRLGPERETWVGISLGYACLPEDAATSVELRLRADQALYDAKEAGKRAFCRSGRAPVSPIAA